MTSSWMLVAGLLFATSGAFVKLGSQEFGAAELAFYRSLLTMLAAMGMVRMHRGTVRSPYFGTHVTRSLMGAASLMGLFYAISVLPLATAMTLNYTAPLFLALATTAVLRERYSPWLVVAIVAGFVGVALLLQPNFEEGKEGAAVIGLLSGVLAAWAYLSVRTLGRLGEPDWRVVFWFGAISTVVCAAWQLAAGGFHPVRWSNAWILAALGGSGFLAQLAMTRAYRTGNTLVVGAYSYSTIVFATAATIVFWSERLSALEWAGMAVVVASGILAMRAERREKIAEAGIEG